ncbi:MAG: trigger factor [Butyrivibrio sp.]|nr:trigger factor [Butyrivibrio sp.]
MKRKIAAGMAIVMTAMALAGCSKAQSDAAYLKDIDLDKMVTLGEYKGVEVEVAAPNVTDAEVDSYLQYMESSMAATEEVTGRAVETGDTVNIDYAGRYAESGEAFDGGTAQGYNLVIGSGSFIDGFEDGLIGAEIGETRDLNLVFPENYGNADLAGVSVVFTVTVNSIAVKPAFDDAYVATLGIENVTNIEELKSYLKDRLMEDAQTTYDNQLQSKVVEAVKNNCMFKDPSQAMIDRFSAAYNDQAEQLASFYSANYGTSMTADSVLQMLMSQDGYTGEAADYMNQKAIETAEQYVMLAAIAKAENIEVTEDELNKELEDAMASANSTAAEGESFENLDAYKETADVENVKERLLARKTIEFLAQNASVVEPAGEEEK